MSRDLEIRSCPSFPGYFAREDGVIFSHFQVKFGKSPGKSIGSSREMIFDFSILREETPYLANTGYLCLGRYVLTEGVVSRCGISWVHRLVLDAFVGPKPSGKCSRHLDGNRLNNRRENLQYGSYRENSLDSVKHGTCSSLSQKFRDSSRRAVRKLSVESVLNIRYLFDIGNFNIRDMSKYFGISLGSLFDIREGRTWKTVQLIRYPRYA